MGEIKRERGSRAGNDSKEEGLGVIVGLFTRTLGLNFRPKHGLSPVSHFCHPGSCGCREVPRGPHGWQRRRVGLRSPRNGALLAASTALPPVPVLPTAVLRPHTAPFFLFPTPNPRSSGVESCGTVPLSVDDPNRFPKLRGWAVSRPEGCS